MTKFAAIKTFGRLSRNKHPVVHAVISQINVIGKGYVRVNEGVGLSPERHDMRQVGVFNSQGNGSDRGYQFAKVRNITRKNGVRNFWIDVGKTIRVAGLTRGVISMYAGWRDPRHHEY